MGKRPCPYCAEEIHEEARRCPYCRSRLPALSTGGWHRGHPERRIAGVAAAIAATTGVPLPLVRAAFIALCFVHAAGLILYVALWLTMPAAPGADPVADRAIEAVRGVLGLPAAGRRGAEAR